MLPHVLSVVLVTNNELDELYTFLKLSGQLRGNMLDHEQVEWSCQATGWHTLEELEEMATCHGLYVNYDNLIDMPYQEWRYHIHVDYLFDLDYK